MSQVLGISVLTNIRKSLTLSGFLRKISYTSKEILDAAGEKKFTQGIGRLLEKRDYSVQSLFPVVKEAFGPLGSSDAVTLDKIYDYLVLKVDEDARDRVFTKEESDFMIIFIAIYEIMLKSEETSESDEFYITHGFQFLTKKEVQELENEEYKRFMKAFKEDHIYALMKMSRDLKGYNTLDHVVGVHHVGMFIARQLKILGLPIDLGRVSGALAGHDIGKYGVKLNEMRRVPYLHYYYSDIWFKKHGIDYIRNVAVNHSTWDLELENLSLEALVLIYSDFRVKNKSIGEKEEMFIYPLDESFNVILEKLDNVDEAKAKRYRRVYAKLEDFENYLVSLGVEVSVSTKEENRKIVEARKSIRTLKKPAICFGDDIISRLKYHAIDHNIKVMYMLRDEFSMDTLLEEARSLRDWKDLREYIRIFEEYSTYLTQGQKLQVISFLMECLIHPEDDIRHHSAEMLGSIIGSFDEDYRKEIPLEEVAPSSNVSGLYLLDNTLKKILYPGHKVIDSHKMQLGYSFATMIKNLFENLPESRISDYTAVVEKYYENISSKRQETNIFLTEAIRYIPFRRKLKEDFYRTVLKGSIMQRVAVLELITTSYPISHYSEEFIEYLRARLLKVNKKTDITEVFLYMKLAGQLSMSERRTAFEIDLKSRKEEMEEVFLNNLKTATHWIAKRNNIRLLVFYTLDGSLISPINTSLHLCNLLKVSAIESVRRTAGNALMTLLRRLSSYERNEVAVELLRALEIEGHRFTEYIPKPLGRVLLYLDMKEFDEIIDDLLIKVKTANPSVKTLLIKTLGTSLESFIQFGMRSTILNQDEKIERIKSMLSVLLYGMADYENLTIRASFTTIGKVIFASDILTLESKNQVFMFIYKKLITLLTNESRNLLFLCQSVGLNNIYRFMNDYLHENKQFIHARTTKYAFFPGTFDPFTLSHLAIAKLIRDQGYEVYLSIDEFSWSKKTLPNNVRRRILEMSTAGELELYLFPADIPVNIANDEDLHKLKTIFNKEVYMVCGSDVVINASSYKNEPTEHSIHTLNHLVFDRTRIRGARKTIEGLVDHVIFMDLPKALKEVSSSKIRTNIDENRDISSLIDPMAQNYIYMNGFYQKAPVDKSMVSLTFLEKKIYREMDPALSESIDSLFPTSRHAISRFVKDIFQKPSGRVLTLTDRTSGKPIGMSVFHWARSEYLMDEMKSPLFADKVRALNLGRIMVLDGLYISAPDKLRNYHQILLTETLSFGVSRDYECAVFIPKNRYLKEDKFISLLGLYNFQTLDCHEPVYYVDMSTPIALNLDMENILKDPFRSNQKVRNKINETRVNLMKAIGALYPGNLVLPFEPLMLQQGIISLVCQENSVPMEDVRPRILGEYMCVPYGDVLDRSMVPNTVTKSIHSEKYFSSDMKSFTIKEVPFYLTLENQVNTLSSFRKPVILVDTILHKGYRMNALSPLLKSHGIEVRKIITGILSAKGMDMMSGKEYKVDGVYYLPRLKAWFNEKDLYPFMGGDALWRGEYPKRNLIESINLILPYTTPTFIMDAGAKKVYDLSKTAIENAMTILNVIEEEFHRFYERKLTLSSLGQVFSMPRVPDKGPDLTYDLYKAPTYYLGSDLEELTRLEKLIR